MKDIKIDLIVLSLAMYGTPASSASYLIHFINVKAKEKYYQFLLNSQLYVDIEFWKGN